MIIDFNRKQFKPASNIRKTVVRKQKKYDLRNTLKKRKMSNIAVITVRFTGNQLIYYILYIA